MTPRRYAATGDDFDHDDAVMKKKVACEPDMKPDVSLRAKPQFLEQAYDWTLVYDEDNVTMQFPQHRVTQLSGLTEWYPQTILIELTSGNEENF